MPRVKERVSDDAFQQLKKLGVCKGIESWPGEPWPGDPNASGRVIYGPTEHADKAVQAFRELADSLTCNQINLLNELLFRVRMNQEETGDHRPRRPCPHCGEDMEQYGITEPGINGINEECTACGWTYKGRKTNERP
jgi:hypothetical protein